MNACIYSPIIFSEMIQFDLKSDVDHCSFSLILSIRIKSFGGNEKIINNKMQTMHWIVPTFVSYHLAST